MLQLLLLLLFCISHDYSINRIAIPLVSSCSSSKVEIRFERIVRSNPHREYFYVYSGSSASGSAYWSQPRITSTYTTINYDVCLTPGTHAMKLTVTGQSGWATGSKVKVKMGSTILGTYTLNSGTSTVKTFTVPSGPNLSNVDYRVKSYALEKGVYFEVSPLNHANNIKYSISSGSLPSGMSLGAATGKIYGRPTTVIESSRSVSIKIYTSSSNYVTRVLSFRTFENPTYCSSGRVLISISRTTRADAYEEYFTIYKGSSFVYQQPSIMSSTSYSWTICLATGSYSIKVTDTYGDGWSSGSSVTLKNGGMNIGTYRLNSGTSDSYSFTVIQPVDLTKINYPNTVYKATINSYFNTSPRGDTNSVFYEIYSGSLPRGFSLDKNSGAISGRCEDLVTALRVSIKMYVTDDYYRIVNLQFNVQCASGYHTAFINRRTSSLSFQEVFFIYEGKGTSGSRRFTQPDIIDNASYSWFACLSNSIHTLEMIDSYGNGWSSGSYVTIKQNGKTLSYTLSTGRTELVYFTADGTSVSSSWITVIVIVIIVIVIIILIGCCCKTRNNTNKKQLPKAHENKPKPVEKPSKPTEVKVKI